MTEHEVKERIKGNDMAVCQAIVCVYRKQTASEKAAHSTHEVNGVGFNKFDANFLCSLAEQIIRNKDMKRPSLLSPNQIKAGRKAIMKYAGQVARILNGEV